MDRGDALRLSWHLSPTEPQIHKHKLTRCFPALSLEEAEFLQWDLGCEVTAKSHENQ